jgi:hypothetical protein
MQFRRPRKKAPGGKTVCAREHRGEGTQQRNEATEKHDRPAIALEEEPAQHSLSGVEPNEMTPLFQQRFTKSSTNPEPDIVANDRACRGSGDDEADIERVAGACVYGSADQDGFAGHRDAGALHRHD